MGAGGELWVVKKYAAFYGPHDATLDSKHRLLIPSELRRSLSPERDGTALFAITGVNEKIWLMTENAYLEQAEQPLNLTPGKKKHLHNLLWYGTVRRLEIDGNGRILLPADLLEETKTESVLKIVGAGDHIEIWNRVDWIAIQAALKAAREEEARKSEEADEGNSSN